MNRAEAGCEHFDVIIIGGGLAGLTAATLVARAGRSVVVLERASHLGGRAVTHVRQEVRFNLGPHALYCRGRAFRVLREIGVSFTGAFPARRGGLFLDDNGSYPIPVGIGSLLASRLLNFGEKARLVRTLAMLPRLEARRYDGGSLADWIREAAGPGNLAKVLRTLFRVSTYSDDAERLSAGAAIEQLKLALAGNVWYLDGGWQTIVDGLRDRAVEQGAEIRTGVRVESVQSHPDSTTVRLAGGEILGGRGAIVAVGPKEACDLLDLPAKSPLVGWTRNLIPVRAACLDVAMDGLPRPGSRVAFGLDSPFYYSVHSASARLAPEGVAVLHVMKYLSSDSERKAEDIEAELEGFLDRIQPGWRSRVVVRRFLPGMTVAHSLPRADESGLRGRPGVGLTERPGVYLAGDWVGPRGMLADASVTSAEEAAQAVLTELERPSLRTERSARMSSADSVFEEQRPGLARLAYRMLGSLPDADDVIQEAYLRWIRESRDDVASPRAYLHAIVTRLCIDQRQAIESRKKTYIGPWLPDPVVEPEGSDPAGRIEAAESISMAFLVVLESLSPVERAAYLLRRVFDYDYDEIARILDKKEPYCRQLVSRAEGCILERRPRFEADPAESERLTEAFLDACTTGDLGGLVDILAADAILYSDSGGKATAALVPIRGAAHIARFFIGILRKSPPGMEIRRVRVNGQPGVAAVLHDQLINILTFDIVDHRIATCFVVRNPDKLARTWR